jgi:5-methylcytosine-specific restriction endonuclease McrA
LAMADSFSVSRKVSTEPSQLQLHIDHKKSVKNGGDNSDANKAPACAQCNGHKGSMDSPEYTANHPNGSQGP